MLPSNPNLTNEIILAVQWLGRIDNGGATPIGSGVVVRVADEEYLATAKHVADACHNNPVIRRNKKWNLVSWSLVATDPTLDISVLKPEAKLLGIGGQDYNVMDVLYGTIGRALGFPEGAEQVITEMDGFPIPIATPIGVYGTSAASGIHVVGGYINAGFSGGAIVYPKMHRFAIVGIATHRLHITRSVDMLDPASGNLLGRFNINEPSGLLQYTAMDEVLKLIESATRGTSE